MSKSKYFYYVQVTQAFGDENGEMVELIKRYITGLDHKTKMARWEKNKKPLAMSKDLADCICEGLLMNFYEAVVVKSYIELNEKSNWEKE